MRTRDFFFGMDGVLRAPWRILIFMLIASSAFVAAAVLLGAAWQWMTNRAFVRGFAESWAASRMLGAIFFSGAAGVFALLVAHEVSVRFVERRGWEMVGLDRRAARPRTLMVGFTSGLLALAVPALVLIASGWLAVEPVRDGSWLVLAVITLVALAPAALFEELALRGYLFAVLRESWGWKPALLVLSLVFGLSHAWNPGASVLSIALVSLAGVFLGIVLIATGSLYAAWLAHLGWNWTLVALLHTELSGVPMPAIDYRVVDAGPDWLTGGGWGPEGGVAAGAGMLLGIWVLMTRVARREDMSR